MVQRVYVEKKEPLRQEAAALLNELKAVLGISALTGLRLVNRYDAEGLSQRIFRGRSARCSPSRRWTTCTPPSLPGKPCLP